MSLKKYILNEFYKTYIRRLTKICLHSSIITHHRFCSMINMKDDINGTETDYPVEVLVQYVTDSLSTMSSQSVAQTNSTAKTDRTCLRQNIHEIILQCTTGFGLKPVKGKTNITSKYLLNNLTLIMLIFYTARCPVGVQQLYTWLLS